MMVAWLIEKNNIQLYRKQIQLIAQVSYITIFYHLQYPNVKETSTN